MRVRFARERGDVPETLLGLRAMVSPFAEVTVLAIASVVTDRAELGGPEQITRRARRLPHAIRRRRARMRNATPAAVPMRA
jgi:hypothetical protein